MARFAWSLTNLHREMLRFASEAPQATLDRLASRAQGTAVRTADLAHIAAPQVATTDVAMSDEVVCVR